jgi:hypothetical protein
MRAKVGMCRARRAAIVASAMAAIFSFGLAYAQPEGAGTTAAPPAAVAPPTTVEPEAGAPAAAPPAAPKARRRTTAHHATVSHFDIEEANARLALKHDTPIYASPTTGAHQLQHGIAGKYVQVTGVTRHWLRVKLKSGGTGYVQQKDVNMLKPADKIFRLTKDATVRAEPNPWAKKLSAVHRGHNVHVIGIALNYMKIRMRSGLEGYIPTTALE